MYNRSRILNVVLVFFYFLYHCLPSDIKSLQKRLRILLGEFNAGNGATRPEIIAITDNLFKRKRMTKKEVKEISEHVSYTP